jgi:iron complex transport system ATP-binding protein
MNALLHTRSLAIGHPRLRLIQDLGLTIGAGQLLAVIGVNGSGKSTLLRTLCGMHPPLAGEVWVEDRPLGSYSAGERARRISVVYTGRPDVGLLDVTTLVSLGRHPWTGPFGKLTDADHKEVDEALLLAGAHDLRDRPIDRLSDGEMQKVMIARALAQRTPLMLLDEPTAFLDLRARVHVVRLLREIAHERGCAVIFSTHDLQLALDLSDRVLLLRRQGIPWLGTPSEAIAQGVLAAEFDDPHVRFDPEAGVFRAR